MNISEEKEAIFDKKESHDQEGEKNKDKTFIGSKRKKVLLI